MQREFPRPVAWSGTKLVSVLRVDFVSAQCNWLILIGFYNTQIKNLSNFSILNKCNYSNYLVKYQADSTLSLLGFYPTVGLPPLSHQQAHI